MAKVAAPQEGRKPRRLPCSIPFSEPEIQLIDNAAYESRARSRSEYVRRVTLRDAERVMHKAAKASEAGAAA